METGESICLSNRGTARGPFDNFHKETAMRVITFNSSPRGEGISKTGMLLDALVEGMREAGAEVEH